MAEVKEKVEEIANKITNAENMTAMQAVDILRRLIEKADATTTQRIKFNFAPKPEIAATAWGKFTSENKQPEGKPEESREEEAAEERSAPTPF
ncbi:MAG: hypothetical protein M1561_01190 [Gammaproteobacteria bacterium]|nr:hypothetical protein [Gammaproteobacteria bacterium]